MEDLNKKMCLLSMMDAYPKSCVSLKDFLEQLDDRKQMLAVLRKILQKSRDNVKKLKSQQSAIHLLRCRLNHIKQNFPTSIKPPIVVPQISAHATETLQVPLQNKTETNKENIAANNAIRVRKKLSETARVGNVKEEIFNSVPKHIKGHITPAQLNAAVNEINTILTRKYKFLERPQKSLSREEGVKRSNYIAMGKDLKGTPYSIFFMDSDITDFGTTLKFKKKTKDNVFLILRHIGKMKEMRKGRLPRYCILG